MKTQPLDELEMFELLQACYPERFPDDEDETFEAALNFADELSGFDELADLLDEWTNNPKQAKNIINCLVEFLAGDMYWLNENISKVDRETLVAAAKRLEHREAPNP